MLMLCAAIAAIGFPQTSNAEEKPDFSDQEEMLVPETDNTREVFNNLSYEASTCAAYFTILGAGLEASGGDADSVERITTLASNMLQWAHFYGQKAGIKPEAVYARVEMEAKAQSKKIDNTAANISILRKQYGEICLAAAREPEIRVMYWIERLSQ